MKKIEFRAWDENANHMASWEELQEDWKTEGYYDSVFRFDHWVPMQYTGINDCCGIKIYEGDRCIIWIDGYKQSEEYIVKDLESFFKDIHESDSYYRVTNIKVIGNIYETGLEYDCSCVGNKKCEYCDLCDEE